MTILYKMSCNNSYLMQTAPSLLIIKDLKLEPLLDLAGPQRRGIQQPTNPTQILQNRQ